MNPSQQTILKFTKGLPRIPGETNASEPDMEHIDFLEPDAFSVDHYEIKIPGVKSGGIYADTPLTDGRTLIYGALGNVNETLRVNLTASSLVDCGAKLSSLAQMKKACRDFWETQQQTQPVYITHKVAGEPGPRYALLYDIDIDVETPQYEGGNAITRMVTIVIERETYWRSIPPGANPKLWTRLFRDGNAQRWNTTTANVLSSSDHLAKATIFNHLEWLDPDNHAKRNYIDIPAADIVGDAPALCTVIIDGSNLVANQSYLISRSTKPTSNTLRDGNTALQALHLAPAHIIAAYLGTDTSLVNDTGSVLYPPASASRRRGQISFATDATNISRFTWISAPTGGAFAPPPIDENTFRGAFIVFVRARQVGGAATDLRMSLRYGATQNDLDQLSVTDEVTPVTQAGTGNTTAWPMHYMGVIHIPTMSRISVSQDGRGISAPDDSTVNNFRFILYARRVAGTTATLYVSDALFIPIDEVSSKIKARVNTSNFIVMDTTGYFNRGENDPYAAEMYYSSVTVPSSPNPVELAGNGITLEPNVNNRLYITAYDASTESNMTPDNTLAVYVDIVPRWLGYRSV